MIARMCACVCGPFLLGDRISIRVFDLLFEKEGCIVEQHLLVLCLLLEYRNEECGGEQVID